MHVVRIEGNRLHSLPVVEMKEGGSVHLPMIPVLYALTHEKGSDNQVMLVVEGAVST